ncbi:AB-hydrolase YheT [Mycena leptocephala]|nr:AB-hydrolase YheT [Mycena leptocephala]
MSVEFPARKHTVIFPATPVTLPLTRQENEQRVSLQSLVESRCRALFRDYCPPWWLFNGHALTLYASMGKFSKIDQMWYKREILRLTDGGTLGLDFAPIDTSHLDDHSPIALTKRTFGRSLCPASTKIKKGGLGYRVVVVNLRGCQHFTSVSSYRDIASSQMYPQAPLLGVGFSMGAGHFSSGTWRREGPASRLVAGHGTTFEQPHVRAEAAMLSLLTYHSNYQAREHHILEPGRWPRGHVPFPDVETYYDWASSHIVLKDVTVPLLAINSTDDPLVRAVPVDAEAIRTSYSCAPGVVAIWDGSKQIYVDQDGFLRDVGRDGMGCKFIGDGGLVNGQPGTKGHAAWALNYGFWPASYYITHFYTDLFYISPDSRTKILAMLQLETSLDNGEIKSYRSATCSLIK